MSDNTEARKKERIAFGILTGAKGGGLIGDVANGCPRNRPTGARNGLTGACHMLTGAGQHIHQFGGVDAVRSLVRRTLPARLRARRLLPQQHSGEGRRTQSLTAKYGLSPRCPCAGYRPCRGFCTFAVDLCRPERRGCDAHLRKPCPARVDSARPPYPDRRAAATGWRRGGRCSR